MINVGVPGNDSYTGIVHDVLLSSYGIEASDDINRIDMQIGFYMFNNTMWTRLSCQIYNDEEVRL